jgi:WD40 repeat protein
MPSFPKSISATCFGELILKNSQVTSCAIDPLHDIIAIGNGKTIYLMNIITKQEITKCEKHQSDVTSLSFRKDGQILASGGKDNIVYLWNMSSLGKPINKIVLIDPIIQVNFNPCMYTLINLSKTQLGLFRDGEKKKIDKQPLSNTAVQTAWTNDGLQFAIGFENGMISIRDNENDSEIKNLMLSNGEERIWCLTFSNSKHYKQSYTLFVGTWEKNIYIIETFNYSIVDIKKVNYDPICISLFKDDYFMIGSNSNEINMFTKEGIFVTSINETINSWVLCLKSDSKHDSVIACTQEGKIFNFNLIFQTVHSIHEENYVYRSKLMDVIVYNLISKLKIRLIVKRFISKIAIYKSRIAVMLKCAILI